MCESGRPHNRCCSVPMRVCTLPLVTGIPHPSFGERCSRLRDSTPMNAVRDTASACAWRTPSLHVLRTCMKCMRMVLCQPVASGVSVLGRHASRPQDRGGWMDRAGAPRVPALWYPAGALRRRRRPLSTVESKTSPNGGLRRNSASQGGGHTSFRQTQQRHRTAK